MTRIKRMKQRRGDGTPRMPSCDVLRTQYSLHSSCSFTKSRMPSFLFRVFRVFRGSLLLLLVLLNLAAQQSDAQTSRPPNIVFIMADDLGRGHCGCYGQ